jgi:YVTN family beta-propeller protein
MTRLRCPRVKLLALTSVLVLPAAAAAQQLRPLAPHAWSWIATDARSSNSAVFVGDSIALVVDPGLTPAVAREFLAAVRALTDVPVRYAVLTHWHPDHALGITCLADRGVTVVAHGKTRRALAEGAAQAAGRLAAQAPTAAERADFEACLVALPDSIVHDRRRFDLGGVTVEVVHPGWSHTAGDLVVWAPDQRVLVTGDLFNHNASPYLDEGRPAQWIAALDSLIGLGPRAVLAGHFGPSTPADLVRFLKYLRTIESRSGALLARGVPPDSIPGRIRLPEFADFAQFPEYHATIADNAARMVQQRLLRPAGRGETAGFRTIATRNAGDPPEPGDRSAATTSDGRLAFVPNADLGTVTVIDRWNERTLDTVAVGVRPGGGAVLPGDIEYAVAVRGDNRVMFLNTASHRVVDSLSAGIGELPSSVVVAPDGRLAFVNNTVSDDISVIALPERRVIARIPVPAAPVAMAVHPSGRTLWVSLEGGRRATVIAIPDAWRAPLPPPPDSGITDVAVMGMIHGAHRTSTRWGLDQVRATVRRFRPDVVCAEIPPDRWERIWSEYTERGIITDPRIRSFPEYTDVLLPLAVEMGFEIVPCAAWTREMSDLRTARIRQFDTDPAYAELRRAYAARLSAVQSAYPDALDDIDDPRVIHSSAYDERMREELALYDEYQNALIGPGGWSAINAAHLRLVDRAIATHRGQRVLITFGSGHKYMFLDHLALEPGVRLVGLPSFPP